MALMSRDPMNSGVPSLVFHLTMDTFCKSKAKRGVIAETVFFLHQKTKATRSKREAYLVIYSLPLGRKGLGFLL